MCQRENVYKFQFVFFLIKYVNFDVEHITNSVLSTTCLALWSLNRIFLVCFVQCNPVNNAPDGLT